MLAASQRAALSAYLSRAHVLDGADSSAGGADGDDGDGGLLLTREENVGGVDGASDDEDEDSTLNDDADEEGNSGPGYAVPRTRSLRRPNPKNPAAGGTPWNERTGIFAPAFNIIREDNLAASSTIRWFLRAVFCEPVRRIFASCDEAHFCGRRPLYARQILPRGERSLVRCALWKLLPNSWASQEYMV